MTRFAIDAGVALRLAAEPQSLSSGHQLVAPNALRSEALSILYREVREGRRDRTDAKRLLDGVTGLKIRLLGDRVSRAVAWTVAEELGWDDTRVAEYLSVARLQADAFVTFDPALAAVAARAVPVAEFEALGRPC